MFKKKHIRRNYMQGTRCYGRGTERKIHRLHNEQIRDLYWSLNVTGVIRWRVMRWVGRVAPL